MPEIPANPFFDVDFARRLQLADASPRAQRRSDVVGIQHIARGHDYAGRNPTAASDFTVSSTTLVALDTTDLRIELACSGKRPVIVTVSATVVPPASNSLILSALMDGEALEPRLAFAGGTTATLTITGFTEVRPTPGIHTFDLAARITGGVSGTVYSGGDNVARITAREV